MSRFSVGTNWDDEMVRTLASLPDVVDYYGSLPEGVIGHGRPRSSIPPVTPQQAERHIRVIHETGRTFTYLLNAPSLGGRQFTPGTRKAIFETLDWLRDVGTDAVTVAFPWMIEVVKDRHPSLGVKISHNATVLRVEEALHFQQLGAELICLHRCTHRNFPLLARLARELSIPLQLIVTSGCVFGCPNQVSLYHMSITASQSTVGRVESKRSRHGQGFCFSWCHLKKLESPVEIVKAAFVRPEDLHYYEEIGINEFKLDTRVFATAALVERVKAYHDRRWDGDLKALFSLFPLGYATRTGRQMGAPEAADVESSDPAAAFFSISREVSFNRLARVDNRALDHLLDHFARQTCPAACGKCAHCAQLAAGAILFDEGERRKAIKILRHYRDALYSGLDEQ